MNDPRTLRMVGLLLVLGLVVSVLAACAGEVGPAGDRGPQGAAGNNGTDGTDGRDGAEGAAGPMGPDGPAGKTGAKGDTGASGPQIVAGINFADPIYSLEDRGSLNLKGWGFQAGETVLVTMQTNVRDEILMGPDANDFGSFDKTQSAKRVTIAPGTTPGIYTVKAEGTDGTLATTYLTVVESTK